MGLLLARALRCCCLCLLRVVQAGPAGWAGAEDEGAGAHACAAEPPTRPARARSPPWWRAGRQQGPGPALGPALTGGVAVLVARAPCGARALFRHLGREQGRVERTEQGQRRPQVPRQAGPGSGLLRGCWALHATAAPPITASIVSIGVDGPHRSTCKPPSAPQRRLPSHCSPPGGQWAAHSAHSTVVQFSSEFREFSGFPSHNERRRQRGSGQRKQGESFFDSVQ